VLAGDVDDHLLGLCRRRTPTELARVVVGDQLADVLADVQALTTSEKFPGWVLISAEPTALSSM
jgi:hypothetical protein